MEQTARLRHLESTSYNGRLMWEISLPEDNTCQVQSPSFFTGKPGYKVRNQGVSQDLETGCPKLVIMGREQGLSQDLSCLSFGQFTKNLLFDRQKFLGSISEYDCWGFTTKYFPNKRSSRTIMLCHCSSAMTKDHLWEYFMALNGLCVPMRFNGKFQNIRLVGF